MHAEPFQPQRSCEAMDVKQELLDSMENPNPAVAGMMAAAVPGPTLPPCEGDTLPSLATAGDTLPMWGAECYPAFMRSPSFFSSPVVRSEQETQPGHVDKAGLTVWRNSTQEWVGMLFLRFWVLNFRMRDCGSGWHQGVFGIQPRPGA